MNDISSNSWNFDACASLRRRRLDVMDSEVCPFSPNADLSPCLAAECLDSTGAWAVKGKKCKNRIAEYCSGDRPHWEVTPLDVGCTEFYHLQVVCDYSHLDPSEELSLSQAVQTGRGEHAPLPPRHKHADQPATGKRVDTLPGSMQSL